MERKIQPEVHQRPVCTRYDARGWSARSRESRAQTAASRRPGSRVQQSRWSEDGLRPGKWCSIVTALAVLLVNREIPRHCLPLNALPRSTKDGTKKEGGLLLEITTGVLLGL